MYLTSNGCKPIRGFGTHAGVPRHGRYLELCSGKFSDTLKDLKALLLLLLITIDIVTVVVTVYCDYDDICDNRSNHS